MRKRILAASVVLLMFLPSFVIAQSDTPLQEQAQTEPSQEPLPQAEKLIKAIEVKGNKLISTSTILSKIKIRIHQPYYERVVKDDIKRLYDTGFFSDVKIEAQDFEDGLKAIVTVEEKPLVGRVLFEGMRALRSDLMQMKVLKTKPDQYLDYNQLREDVASLSAEYRKRGFANVDISYKVDVSSETNKADVTFVVNENARVRIKRIYIQGNDKVNTGKIISAMKTRQARFLHAGFFKEGEFQDDLERIKILYVTEGFPDATFEHSFDYDDRGFMYIALKIQEGIQYTIGSVRMEGNEDVSTQVLEEQLTKTKPGNIYSEVALQEEVYNLRNYYLSKGYLFVVIKESASIDPETGKVNIAYTIEENEIAYVGKVDVIGNTKTKDKVIRREVRLNPGEKYDGEKLKRSKERLDNLGFFEEVTFDTKPSSLPNTEDLVVEVKEAQTGSLSFGGGYSSVDQLVGFVEIEQKNFDLFNFPNFTGAGQDLILRWQIGSIREEFDLSFTEPWLFDRPISFGVDAYRRIHDKESDVGYGYSEERTGGALRLGKEFSEYFRGDMAYRLEEIDISEVDEDATADLKKEIGSNTLSSMEFILTRDTRDNKFNPTKGIVLSGSNEIVGGPFGGDKDFMKLFTSLTKYVGLTKKSVIEGRVRAGALLTYGNTDDIPIYERFFAGGTYTIRGYNERKVGPIDSVSEDPIGGESILVANLEYTYSLLEFLKLAAFFDTGNVWRKVEDIGSGDFKSGIGFGLRIKTPIGPLRLDYGFPLNTEPGEEDKEGKFHFSMSKMF